jgi:hypothetical protein
VIDTADDRIPIDKFLIKPPDMVVYKIYINI